MQPFPDQHPLRIRRQARGLGLRGLARLTGISFGRISQIEHGYVARADELLKPSAALECDCIDLVPLETRHGRG